MVTTFNDASKKAWQYLVGRHIGVDEIPDDDTLRLYMELDGISGDMVWPGISAADLNTLSASGSDDTARLNAFLATASALGVRKLVGSFSINNTLTIPADTYVDATRATITQTGTDKVSVIINSGSTLFGGVLVGKGTDYIAGGPPLAIGVTTANGATDVTIAGTRFNNFSGASVRVINATDVRLRDLKIVGVGSPTITGGDGLPCYGILVENTSARINITNCVISETCQGIITASLCTEISLINCHTFNIRGQHGGYIQNANGLVIVGFRAADIFYNGIKLQLAVTTVSDSIGVSISDVVARNCGDTGLVLINTAADLANCKKFIGVAINNVVVTSSLRGLYLGSVKDAVVTGVSLANITNDGITLLDCSYSLLSDFTVDACGRVGLRITTQTGAVNDRIDIKDGSIYNPAGNNEASNIYGILIASGSNLDFDSVKVRSTNALMQYSFFFEGGIQTSLSVRDCDFSGAFANDVRLLAGPVAVRDWSNNKVTTATLNFPTALLTKIGSKGASQVYSSSTAPVAGVFPLSGVFRLSDEIVHGASAVGSPKSWVVTTAGGAHGGTWAASTAYAVGDWRRNAAGRVYECTVAGISAASGGPIGVVVGVAEVDNTVTWVCRSTTPVAWTSTGNL